MWQKDIGGIFVSLCRDLETIVYAISTTRTAELRKRLEFAELFFIKFKVLTEIVVTSVSFYGYWAIRRNNKISASNFLQSVTTKRRTQTLTSCNDYIA